MSEKTKARQEACRNASETEYFNARPLEAFVPWCTFCAGFDRGYSAALAAAPEQPINTVWPNCVDANLIGSPSTSHPAIGEPPAQQPWQYTPPAQERIQALELEVRQLTEKVAALRHALRSQQLAPSAAPEEPLQAFDSPRAKSLMRAWEEGWEACRDAEYVGEEAQNDAFNSSHTLTLCLAEDQLLPTPQADSQPAQVLVYPPLPDPFIGVQNKPLGGHAEVIRSAIGEDGVIPRFTAGQMVAYADATHAARAPADSVLEDAAPSQAARDVLAERQRQISVEGWTPEHDDEHECGDMARAAACYLLVAAGYPYDDVAILRFWPWIDAWKPTDQRRNLVKAGALILAEIERIDRAARKQGANHD